jgi:hypothetical protein
MLGSYSKVPKARRCKLLQRHEALRVDVCDVLGGGGMSSGYQYPGEPYRVYRIRPHRHANTSSKSMVQIVSNFGEAPVHCCRGGVVDPRKKTQIMESKPQVWEIRILWTEVNCLNG